MQLFYSIFAISIIFFVIAFTIQKLTEDKADDFDINTSEANGRDYTPVHDMTPLHVDKISVNVYLHYMV